MIAWWKLLSFQGLLEFYASVKWKLVYDVDDDYCGPFGHYWGRINLNILINKTGFENDNLNFVGESHI